jgi:putative membrane protein (TIGR04086 family)
MNPMKQASQVRISSPMLSGLAYAFITMAVAALVSSLLLIAADQGEDALPTYAIIIHGLSALAGSFVCGRRSTSKGWYHGGVLGLLYIAIVLLVGFLSFDRDFNWNTLLFAAGAFVVGAFGGILGVNTKR